MSEVRRGSAAIQEAAKSSGGGEFKPFLRSIYWGEDGQEHYLLFLNDIEELPLFDMITYIPTENGFFQETVARTSPPLSEKRDEFEEEWSYAPSERNIAIAVELEPVVEVTKRGGKTQRKPRGFEVKTIEYERRIFDDDGEATGETEEVVAPAVGYISQSPNNFFNQVANYDAKDAPITETALKITRIGKDISTNYQITGYDEMAIDLSNLIGCIDGVSYLTEDLDDLIEEIDGLDEREAALCIGKRLLALREAELLDAERYEELFEGVTEPAKYGKKKKTAKEDKKTTRRGSSSRSKASKAAEADDGDDPDEPTSDPGPTEEVEAKPKARAKGKAAKQTPADRMEELKARAAKAAAARK
jgi:hypothetical protein